MKQNHGLSPLTDKIGQVLKPIFAKRKDDFLILGNLSKNWQKIVGEKCWQFCHPKKVKFEKNKKANGVLSISAYNSSIGFYLEANSSQIIENIASYYGYKIISEIRIIQEPKQLDQKPKEVAEEINQKQQDFILESTTKIEDKELKNILQKLGKSIWTKKSS
ncbi:MAG: hypothetical protein K0R25_1024 [Rickettsiaceae bacterium]|jgi:hypothetical protein|nr:hypothetical protein [Rickettsiaceae bacterium]